MILSDAEILPISQFQT